MLLNATMICDMFDADGAMRFMMPLSAREHAAASLRCRQRHATILRLMSRSYMRAMLAMMLTPHYVL